MEVLKLSFYAYLTVAAIEFALVAADVPLAAAVMHRFTGRPLWLPLAIELRRPCTTSACKCVSGTARALRRFRGCGRRVALRQLVPLSRAPVFGCGQGQGCRPVRRCNDQNQAIGRTENC